MDPDLEVQSILTRFRHLDKLHRRVAYHGILDQLRSDEWREVKHRIDPQTFQCDLLGKLPIEIVALVAEYMNLTDLILHQRVSKRWHRVLSSPLVYRAAVHATIGADTLAGTHPGYIKCIKKRLRLERGQPAATATIPSPLSTDYDVTMYTRGVGYSHGVYAWIDGRTSRTSISLLHLWTGKNDHLTTENREQLVELRIAETLIAAVSARGYCHVWHLHTQEHKSFRIPSSHYRHFLVHGVKVALGYEDYIVHWCFHSGFTRRIPTGAQILALALHPLEDQFTVVREEAPYYTATAPPGRWMKTAQYSVNPRDELDRIESECFMDQFCYDWIEPISHEQEVIRGQSSALMLRPGFSHEIAFPFFSLELADDRVVTHLIPNLPRKFSNLVSVSQDIIYAPQIAAGTLAILDSRRLSPCGYKHCIQRMVACPKDCCWVFGDSEFVVIVGFETVQIWSLDETWQASVMENWG
ncbi:hypothetical protein NUU61_005582 [Penicillium alfredii]|uniref:F-box domain-containing protein n=1 Tax=Penicillium alfredii TaxID=1506179 RepID=A0A9W9K8B6_9EURO|nr:uncharacterized protein NUU61_005582 [Penicillium alfredii]KAJ5096226.1 hypothetical protein NUU61_005582 [Penicillium alfredii]